MKYVIKDSRFFHSLNTRQQKAIRDLIAELNSKQVIEYNRLDRNSFVDLENMIREGAILKKYKPLVTDIEARMTKYTFGKKYYLNILSRILGVKEYHIRVRLQMLNVNLKAINAYYSKAIQFYDVQTMIYFPKDIQEHILSTILEAADDMPRNRYKRAAFFHQFTAKVWRKKDKIIHDFADNEFKKKEREVILKQKSKEKKEEIKIVPINKEDKVEKFEMITVPVEAVFGAPPSSPKEEIAPTTNKEQEYYDNLDMVVPEIVVGSDGAENNNSDSKNEYLEWKKKNAM